MGKLIICNGKQALTPFHIKITDTRIYSIEELCYYIYNHIDIITEELFQDSLVCWMEKELLLGESAIKLKELIGRNAGLKDVVVCILCSSDYYTEADIKQLLHTIDEITNLTPFERMKKKADNCLKFRQFIQAASEYENIINGKEAAGLTSEEYGNLLHNLGIAQLNVLGPLLATDSFKEAYEKNHNTQSLIQYLYALKLSKQEERLQREIINLSISQDMLEQVLEDIERTSLEAEESEAYGKVTELVECKQAGKISNYYALAEELIGQWKQKFRIENA